MIAHPGSPPDGWIKAPAGVQRGGPWEQTPGDDFYGSPYYRQRLSSAGDTPENFTVRIGERWAASMQTMEWAKIRLADIIQADLPAFLRPVFPYGLFVDQLMSGSDQYISLVAHESFHAYQGMTAPAKLADCENASTYESSYPWSNETHLADWQAELDLLTEALASTDPSAAAQHARRFLALRAERRKNASLSDALVGYEQRREWSEGLARFEELEIWRLASKEGYAPLPAIGQDPDFENYRGFDTRWKQEIGQIGRMADDEGDGRFYYTGMVQSGKQVRMVNRPGGAENVPDSVGVVASDAYDVRKNIALTQSAVSVYQCAQPAYS